MTDPTGKRGGADLSTAEKLAKLQLEALQEQRAQYLEWKEHPGETKDFVTGEWRKYTPLGASSSGWSRLPWWWFLLVGFMLGLYYAEVTR